MALRRKHKRAEQPPTVLHEPLTGLYNRTFLLELMALETRRTERFGGSFSVVAGSLDDFLTRLRVEGRPWAGPARSGGAPEWG